MSVEREIVCRIDLPDEANASVRVIYTEVETTIVVIGVFRMDDDSEIDFKTLPPLTKESIENNCELDLAQAQEDKDNPYETLD
jgi:hypothetical protein